MDEPTPTHFEVEALLFKCRSLGSQIFVREEIDGKWDNIPLDVLADQRRVQHEARWIVELFQRLGWVPPSDS